MLVHQVENRWRQDELLVNIDVLVRLSGHLVHCARAHRVLLLMVQQLNLLLDELLDLEGVGVIDDLKSRLLLLARQLGVALFLWSLF